MWIIIDFSCVEDNNSLFGNMTKKFTLLNMSNCMSVVVILFLILRTEQKCLYKSPRDQQIMFVRWVLLLRLHESVGRKDQKEKYLEP